MDPTPSPQQSDGKAKHDPCDETDDTFLPPALDDGPSITWIRPLWSLLCQIIDVIHIESHPAECEPDSYWEGECTPIFY